jgi:hypothetical protein
MAVNGYMQIVIDYADPPKDDLVYLDDPEPRQRGRRVLRPAPDNPVEDE